MSTSELHPTTLGETITVSCLCGQTRQNVQLPTNSQTGDSATALTTLCHCDTCRHTSGLLFTSYLPIAGAPSSLEGLQEYATSASSSRYFCAKCGCHVFRSSATPGQQPNSSTETMQRWEVATGTVIASADHEGTDGPLKFSSGPWKHLHASDTKDGGLAIFLPHDSNMNSRGTSFSSSTATTTTTLPLSCHCHSVNLHLTRPNEQSLLPHSGFSDLIHPFAITDASIVSNPFSVKWWIRDPPSASSPSSTTTTATDISKKRYLAGTCACRSCRLGCGFEVQVWAFVPRANILVTDTFSSSATSSSPTIPTTSTPTGTPLDFTSLPASLSAALQSFESSPGVLREFCGVCGATVFWHDKWRPDLIDVSVGLLRGAERDEEGGSRAEGWLDWWTTRTSFAEETGRGRTGFMKGRALRLIRELEEGLDAWGTSGKGRG